jgi:wobble nucleotide-excising tRNase
VPVRALDFSIERLGGDVRNVILGIVLVAGLIVGYFAGSWSSKGAKEALRLEEQRSAEAKKESELAQKTLQEKMTALVAEHNGRVETITREKSDALTQLETERKGRSKAIQEASAAKTALDKRIEELNKLRNAAQPGSADKKNIEAEMGRLAAENAALQQRVTGLECGKVPLPKETLDKFTFRVS